MALVKLSYSILNTWKQARFEEAVAQYLGKPLIPTPAMELGKVKHKVWEQHINKYQELPEDLGRAQLIAPRAEQKYEKVIPLGKHQILFRGVIDLEDNDIITDFKCGLGEPAAYLDTWQLDAYKLLRPNAKEGRYICYNPYRDTYKVGVKFLSDLNAELALENIITFGSEMIDYLSSQRLLIDYKE
jgi:hypothetical protein